MKITPPPDKKYENEAQFVADVLLHFGALDWMWIWRENTGRGHGAHIVQQALRALIAGHAGMALQILRSSRPIIFGIPGRADIMGIIRREDHNGRPVAIECKAADGRRSKEQIAWSENFIRFGGVYILAKQLSDIYVGLEAAGYGDLL